MVKMTEVRRAFVGKNLAIYDSWSGSNEVMLVKDVKKRRNGCYEFVGERKVKMVEDCIVQNLLEGRKKIERQEIDHCIVTKEWSVFD